MNPEIEKYYQDLVKRGKFKESDYTLDQFSTYLSEDGAIEALHADDVKDGLYKPEDYTADQMRSYLSPAEKQVIQETNENPQEIQEVPIEQDELDKIYEDSGDVLSQEAKKKTYFSGIGAKLKAGTATMLTSLSKGAEALAIAGNPFLSKKSEILEAGMDAAIEQGRVDGWLDDEKEIEIRKMTDEAIRPLANSDSIKAIDQWAEDESNSVKYSDQGVVETFKKDGVIAGLSATGFAFTESVPQIIGMLATGGAGLGVAGISAGGAKFDELKKSGVDNTTAIVNGTVTGFGEALMERVTMGIAKGTGGKITSAVKGEIKEAVKKSLAKSFTKDILKESSSEGATQLIENITDVLTGVSKPDEENSMFSLLTNGIADAAIIGAFGGVTMSAPGQVADLVSKKNNPAVSTEAFNNDDSVAPKDSLPKGEVSGDGVVPSPVLTNDSKIETIEEFENADSEGEIKENKEKETEETIDENDAVPVIEDGGRDISEQVEEGSGPDNDGKKNPSAGGDSKSSSIIDNHNIDLNEDGKLEVTKDGKRVQKRKRERILDKYIEENIGSMKNSKDPTELPDGITEGEVNDYLAANSESANEIADAYLLATKDAPIQTKEDVIDQELSKRKFTKEQLQSHFGDNIIDGDWKGQKGKGIIKEVDVEVDGGNLNEVAQRLNEELGRNDITDQDVADYIQKYRFGNEIYQSKGINTFALEERFSKLTGGVPLNPRTAAKLSGLYNKIETERLESNEGPQFKKGKKRFGNFHERFANNPTYSAIFKKDASDDSNKRENISLERTRYVADEIENSEIADAKGDKDAAYIKIFEGILNSDIKLFSETDNRFDASVNGKLMNRAMNHFATQSGDQSATDIALRIGRIMDKSGGKAGAFIQSLRSDSDSEAQFSASMLQILQHKYDLMQKRNSRGETINQSIDNLFADLKRERTSNTKLDARNKKLQAKINEAYDLINTGFVGNVDPAQTRSKLSDQVISDKKAAAIAKFKKGSGNLTSGGIDVARLEALAEIAYYTFLQGARTFNKWAKQMRADLGNLSTEELKSVWNEGKFEGQSLNDRVSQKQADVTLPSNDPNFPDSGPQSKADLEDIINETPLSKLSDTLQGIRGWPQGKKGKRLADQIAAMLSNGNLANGKSIKDVIDNFADANDIKRSDKEYKKILKMAGDPKFDNDAVVAVIAKKFGLIHIPKEGIELIRKYGRKLKETDSKMLKGFYEKEMRQEIQKYTPLTQAEIFREIITMANMNAISGVNTQKNANAGAFYTAATKLATDMVANPIGAYHGLRGALKSTGFSTGWKSFWKTVGLNYSNLSSEGMLFDDNFKSNTTRVERLSTKGWKEGKFIPYVILQSFKGGGLLMGMDHVMTHGISEYEIHRNEYYRRISGSKWYNLKDRLQNGLSKSIDQAVGSNPENIANAKIQAEAELAELGDVEFVNSNRRKRSFVAERTKEIIEENRSNEDKRIAYLAAKDVIGMSPASGVGGRLGQWVSGTLFKVDADAKGTGNAILNTAKVFTGLATGMFTRIGSWSANRVMNGTPVLGAANSFFKYAQNKDGEWEFVRRTRDEQTRIILENTASTAILLGGFMSMFDVDEDEGGLFFKLKDDRPIDIVAGGHGEYFKNLIPYEGKDHFMRFNENGGYGRKFGFKYALALAPGLTALGAWSDQAKKNDGKLYLLESDIVKDGRTKTQMNAVSLAYMSVANLMSSLSFAQNLDFMKKVMKADGAIKKGEVIGKQTTKSLKNVLQANAWRDLQTIVKLYATDSFSKNSQGIMNSMAKSTLVMDYFITGVKVDDFGNEMYDASPVRMLDDIGLGMYIDRNHETLNNNQYEIYQKFEYLKVPQMPYKNKERRDVVTKAYGELVSKNFKSLNRLDQEQLEKRLKSYAKIARNKYKR